MNKVKTYKCMLVSDGEQEFAGEFATSYNESVTIFMEKMRDLPCEEIHVLYLNNRNKIVGHEMIARGGVDGAAVNPRDVFRGAVAANSCAIILGHNHPSGDPRPSVDDIKMTRSVIKAGELLGVPLLDHVIVCPEEGTHSSIVEKLG